MNKSTTLALLLAAALVASIFAGLTRDNRNATPAALMNASEPDPIIESFEREFNREPGPARPVERTAIDEDVLYHTANSVHWTEEKPADK